MLSDFGDVSRAFSKGIISGILNSGYSTSITERMQQSINVEKWAVENQLNNAGNKGEESCHMSNDDEALYEWTGIIYKKHGRYERMWETNCFISCMEAVATASRFHYSQTEGEFD